MKQETPKLPLDGGNDVLDALFQLTAVCAVGHIRWPVGTRGHREASHALRRASEILIKSRYRVPMAEWRAGLQPHAIETEVAE